MLEEPDGRGGEVLQLEIPYQSGQTLPSYLFMLLRDITSKEKEPRHYQHGRLRLYPRNLFSYVAAGARKTGYAVIAFDGPGRGIFFRKMTSPTNALQGTYMRHDWGAVILQVVDCLATYAGEHRSLYLDFE